MNRRERRADQRHCGYESYTCFARIKLPPHRLQQKPAKEKLLRARRYYTAGEENTNNVTPRPLPAQCGCENTNRTTNGITVFGD